MSPLQKKYPGLVWSNSHAPQEIFIRKALLNPLFTRLLEMARDFGLDALIREWDLLKKIDDREINMARKDAERILTNIRIGMQMKRR